MGLRGFFVGFKGLIGLIGFKMKSKFEDEWILVVWIWYDWEFFWKKVKLDLEGEKCLENNNIDWYNIEYRNI